MLYATRKRKMNKSDVIHQITVSPGCGYTSMSEHQEDVLLVDCVTGLWLHKYVRASRRRVVC